LSEPDPPETDPLLDRAWAQREEVAYPAVFGDLGAGIYPLEATLFKDAFGQADIDPRWLHYGVFRSAPSGERPHWAFVTSGLSNPWEADTPEEVSGLGHEFVLEATTGSDWLLRRMQHVLAFQILLAHGRYIGRDLLAPYDRLPLRGSIDPEGRSALVRLLVCPPAEPSRSISLISGKFELYSLVGITEAEAQYARDEGGDRLEALLRSGHAHPVMDAERRSLV
jgi:Suppressor of fused protein (SUFU)